MDSKHFVRIWNAEMTLAYDALCGMHSYEYQPLNNVSITLFNIHFFSLKHTSKEYRSG